ncbi:hypothetical protein [Saccharothrix deserti]|uniref:hypothetical protein n=1 Tax=Saccharothrix deserti TaxID=2593674 RepID=UPI00131C5BFA|nr:hypothetical protein [Saccharothrix deserti]
MHRYSTRFSCGTRVAVAPWARSPASSGAKRQLSQPEALLGSLSQLLSHPSTGSALTESARREHDRTLARKQRLDEPAQDEQATWTRVDALITTRKPTDYDAAVALLADLQAPADREDRPDEFARRHAALRQAHKNKPSLIARLARVNL